MSSSVDIPSAPLPFECILQVVQYKQPPSVLREEMRFLHPAGILPNLAAQREIVAF
jgi:hypothetical protein